MAKRFKLVFLIWFLTLIVLGGMLSVEPGIAMILSLVPAGLVALLAKPKKFEAVTVNSDDTKPRLSDTSELQGIEPVRGVWEDVFWEYEGFSEAYQCKSDRLHAVGVFVTADALYYFSEDKQTWEEAKTGALSPNAQLSTKVMLADIQSIQMEPANQFHGDDARKEFVKPKTGGKDFLQQRHPSLDWQDHGFHDNNAKQNIVYAFTKEGDRIRLFQTWSRDLAIKWRTQVSNRIDAVVHAAPEAAKPEGGQPDYI